MEVRVFSTAPLLVKDGHRPIRSCNHGSAMGQHSGFAFDDDAWSDKDLLDERTRDPSARMAIGRYDALTDDLSESLRRVPGDRRGPAIELLPKGYCRLRKAVGLRPAISGSRADAVPASIASRRLARRLRASASFISHGSSSNCFRLRASSQVLSAFCSRGSSRLSEKTRIARCAMTSSSSLSARTFGHEQLTAHGLLGTGTNSSYSGHACPCGWSCRNPIKLFLRD